MPEPTEHGVTGGLELAPRRVPQPQKLTAGCPLSLAWALVIPKGCVRGRLKKLGTNQAVLVERQTLGPECRAGFLESPEKCPALSWGDWGEGG